jgi:hypothetical protein
MVSRIKVVLPPPDGDETMNRTPLASATMCFSSCCDPGPVPETELEPLLGDARG